MNNWQRFCVIFAGISGAIAVAMGAASAHWLQAMLDTAAIMRIEKAATYQMYHSIALLAVTTLMEYWRSATLRIAALLMAMGVICFSGSLYGYSFTGASFFMWITPFGGFMWIAAWFCIACAGIFCCSAQKITGQ